MSNWILFCIPFRNTQVPHSGKVVDRDRVNFLSWVRHQAPPAGYKISSKMFPESCENFSTILCRKNSTCYPFRTVGFGVAVKEVSTRDATSTSFKEPPFTSRKIWGNRTVWSGWQNFGFLQWENHAEDLALPQKNITNYFRLQNLVWNHKSIVRTPRASICFLTCSLFVCERCPEVRKEGRPVLKKLITEKKGNSQQKKRVLITEKNSYLVSSWKKQNHKNRVSLRPEKTSPQ